MGAYKNQALIEAAAAVGRSRCRECNAQLDILLRAADTGLCWRCLLGDYSINEGETMSNGTEDLFEDRPEDRTRTCEHCGEKFLINPDFDFAKLCKKCAMKRLRALEQHDDLIEKVRHLQAELNFAKAQQPLPFDNSSPALSPDDCTAIIRLLQPHHQAGDRVAYRAIRFLADMRKTHSTKTPDQEG